MEESLPPFYHSTEKTTPVVPPVAETATEEKPATRVPEILSEERILEYLRQMLTRRIGESRNTEQLRQSFREDRKKVYPDHLHLIEQVLSEMLPTEGQASLPVPVPEEPAIVPETKDILSVSDLPEPESHTTQTADAWVDEVLAEVQEQVDIPHWKSQQIATAHEKKLTKRQVERRQVKHTLQDFVDYYPAKEFTTQDLLLVVPQRKLSTVTAIVKELWKEGLVKGRIEVRTMSRKPQKRSTWYYVITSLANPSTHYYPYSEELPWVKKKKLGTRQREVGNQTA